MAPLKASMVSRHGVYEMARRGFTASEIAKHFDVSRRTLFYRFSHDRELHLAFTKGRAEFQCKLLRKVTDNALKLGHRRSLVTMAKQFGIGVERDRDWPAWLG